MSEPETRDVTSNRSRHCRPADNSHLVFAKLVGIEAFQPLLQPVVVGGSALKSTVLALSMTVSSTRIGERVRSASAIASLGRASIATRSPRTVRWMSAKKVLSLQVADDHAVDAARRGP